MKKLRLANFAVLVVAACCIVGCKSTGGRLDGLLFTPTEFQTNVRPARVVNVVTNQAVIVSTTNAAGIVASVTNFVPVIVTLTLPPETNVVPSAWKPNEATVAAVQGAGALVPGWGGIASTGIAAALGILAHLRSRRFKAAAVSLIDGVNAIVEKAPNLGPDILATQKSIQNLNGTRATVRKLLEAKS